MSDRAERLGLEPGASTNGSGLPNQHEIEHSQAISLKRIADALTGAGPNILATPLNAYGEGIGDCIQGQFERGQR